MSITLVMITRNEENCVERAILSALPYVSDFRWLDTGSDDRTVEILKQYGSGVRLLCDFLHFDFGEAKTAVSRMAQTPWILLLDADEELVNGHLMDQFITEEPEVDCWALPRRRWADLGKTQQVELEAWPDFQRRLYQNKPHIRWNNPLHEKLDGAVKVKTQMVIGLDHFVDVYHLADPTRRSQRAAQRTSIAKRAGIKVEGTPLAAQLAGIDWETYGKASPSI